MTFRIWSMHGPTVYSSDTLDRPLPGGGYHPETLLDVLARLSTPASNAGFYALVAEMEDGSEYELHPFQPSEHTHGYRTFCRECWRQGTTQRSNPQPGDTQWP